MCWSYSRVNLRRCRFIKSHHKSQKAIQGNVGKFRPFFQFVNQITLRRLNIWHHQIFFSLFFLFQLLLAAMLSTNAVSALLPMGNPWHQRINLSLCLILVIGNKFYLVIVLVKSNKETVSADKPLLSQSNRLALIYCRWELLKGPFWMCSVAAWLFTVNLPPDFLLRPVLLLLKLIHGELWQLSWSTVFGQRPKQVFA